MNRRGQVALFVLIGVALLLLILLLLFRNSLFGASVENTLDVQHTSQVQSFIAGCGDASLEKLIRQAGANGGYLDTSRLRHGPFTWESDVVDFPPQEVPYWSHLKQCSESEAGCEATEQPPLCKQGAPCPIKIILPNTAPSIQEQLEQALPAEVESCLDGFKALARLDHELVEQVRLVHAFTPSAAFRAVSRSPSSRAAVISSSKARAGLTW